MRSKLVREPNGSTYRYLAKQGTTRIVSSLESKKEGLLEPDSGIRPMEMLLGGLAGCMAIDVEMILSKQRQDIRELDIKMESERNEAHPRTFSRIHLSFAFKGVLDERKVERAIDLSLNKYCPVRHSLDPSIEITTSYSIQSVGS